MRVYTIFREGSHFEPNPVYTRMNKAVGYLCDSEESDEGKREKKNVLCEHYVSIDYRAIGCHEYKHCSFYSLLPTNY